MVLFKREDLTKYLIHDILLTMSEQSTGHENATPREPIEVIDESLGFDAADNLNVPVHVVLYEEIDDQTDEKTGHYALTADGFLTRKDRLDEDMFGVRSKDPEQLRQVVAERIVPLYEVALDSLRGIVAGTNSGLYDWRASSEQSQAPNSDPEAS
jgi:hypothetical protein